MFLGLHIVGAYFFCIIYTHINTTCEDRVKEHAPYAVNVIWCSTSVIYLIVSMYLGNW